MAVDQNEIRHGFVSECERSAGRPLASLEPHAWRLSEFLSEIALVDGRLGAMANASEWLRMAGGLHSVGIDSGRFDRSLLMCRRTAEYEDARSRDWECYALELTRLLYVWSSFECCAAAIKGKRTRGLVSWGLRYLAEHDDPPQLPLHYECTLSMLRALGDRDPTLYRLRAALDESDGQGTSGRGLRAAATLRNRLAHGDLALPEPTEWGGSGRRDVVLTALGIRALLFTVQMMCAPLSANVRLVRYDDETDEERDLPARELLAKLHLELADSRDD